MVPRTLERGSFLSSIGENSSAMYVLQSGLVEITHKLDKGEEFVIERLYRSSIINHNSFLMNDPIDTDAKCKTQVRFYELNVSDLEKVKKKHVDM